MSLIVTATWYTNLQQANLKSLNCVAWRELPTHNITRCQTWKYNYWFCSTLSPRLPSYSSICVHLQYNPIKTIKTNTKGTLNMLGMAKRVGVRLCLRVSYYFAIVIYSFLWWWYFDIRHWPRLANSLLSLNIHFSHFSHVPPSGPYVACLDQWSIRRSRGKYSPSIHPPTFLSILISTLWCHIDFSPVVLTFNSFLPSYCPSP